MKRAVAAILTFAIMFAAGPGTGVYAESKTAAVPTELAKNTVAYAVFDDETITSGMRVAVGDVDEKNIVIQNGKKGLVLDPGLAEKNRYLYVDVDDDIMYALDDGTAFDVEIEYFDAEQGTLTMKYPYYYSWNSNMKSVADPDSAGRVVSKETDILDFADTQVWRTYSWYLPDAAMKNTLNGYDFSIGIYGAKTQYSKGKAIIRSIKINKRELCDRITVDVSSESMGNIFFTGEDMVLTCSFDNSKYPFYVKRDGKYALNAKYSLIDSKGKIVSEQTDTFDIKPFEKVERTVMFKPEKYDCYKLKVEAVNEEYKTFGTKEVECSYVRSTKGKIKNPRAGISISNEITQYSDRAAELIENAGFSYARLHLARSGWSANSVYNGNEVAELRMSQGIDTIVQSMVSHGLKMTAYESFPMGDGLTSYNRGTEWMPTTQEDMEEFLNSQYTYIDKMGDSIVMFELLNEVGNKAYTQSWNADLAANLIKYVLPKIKEKYPDLLISSPQDNISHQSASLFEFARLFIAEGGADDVDIYSIHPYKNASVKDRGFDQIKKIRDELDTRNKEAELWATEYGRSTYSDGIVSDYEQACQDVLTTLMFYEEDIVPQWFLFRLDNCRDNEPRYDREAHFGCVRSFSTYYTGTRAAAKPKYLAFSNLNIELADAEYAGKIDPEEGVTLGYKFRKTESGEDLVVLLTDRIQTQTSLDLGTNEVTVLDFYGNETKMKSTDGVFTFSFSNAPIYVKGNFTKCDVTENSAVYVSQSDIESVNETGEFKIYNKTGKNLKAEFEVMANSEVAIEESADIDGEEYTVKYSLGSTPAVKNEPIHVTISGDDGIYYDGDVKLNRKIDVGMYSVMNISEDNNWELEVTLENHLSTGEVSGKLQFISPESWMKLIEPVDVSVKSGETKTVKIPVPKDAEKEKGKLTTLAFITDEESGNGIYKLQKYDFAYFNKTQSPVTIDGDLSEWSDSWIMVNEPDQFISEWGLYNQYGGVEDINAKIQCMWDEDNLYFASVVYDDVFYTDGASPSTMWMVDDWQLGIAYDPKEELTAGQYEELSFALLNGTPEIYRHITAMTLAEPTQVKNCEMHIARDETAKTTTYEVKIPWSSLIDDFGDKKMETGEEIKFAALLNENDGNGRKGYYTVGTGIHDTKTTTNFLRFTLVDIY